MAEEPSFHVEVVSAEQRLLSVDAVEVYARSVDGEIGILPGHQPALLALDIAPVRIVRDDDEIEHVAVHEGFLYYRRDRLVILASLAELASEIDLERAEQRRRQLQEALAGGEDEALEASLRKQEVRIRVAERR